eukprot:TRINITY_DN2059_c0_g2_i1.p1 TRINITY_DN2059_c0_g2~~TRINITY_DN2059_c0_g2_i1.p1  ORF type:complete len:378 (-),score=19.28 TRINITY_DN2059_c0_g2_i1:59-1192(-)
MKDFLLIFCVLAISLQICQSLPQTSNNPCFPNPCGPGANCENRGANRAICTCPEGWLGDPTTSCEPECIRLSDCRFDQQCQGTRCVDPCTNNVETGRPPCGTNAICERVRHKAICSCPKTHTGDPFTHCRPFTSADLCNPNPCGANAFCEPGFDKRTGEERPVCLCNEGYTGDGVRGCVRGDCISLQHHMCPDNRACYDSKCIDPCGPDFCGGQPCCAPNALCRGVEHKAECSCPSGYEGDARYECRLAPRGSGSNNRIRSGGSSSSGSLCDPNPCGVDAVCRPGSDNTGKSRPVCTCPNGYKGNALVACRRGECFQDSECPSHLACFDFKCQDPCNGACGRNTQCQVRNHGPVCACEPGYEGDALTSCFRSNLRSG